MKFQKFILLLFISTALHAELVRCEIETNSLDSGFEASMFIALAALTPDQRVDRLNKVIYEVTGIDLEISWGAGTVTDIELNAQI